jgi:hypothetical protein
MTKKIVVMTIVVFMMTSHVVAMLVKVSKKPLLNFSQIKSRTLFGREQYFRNAIQRDDVELVDFLLEKGESAPITDIMRSHSIGMIDLFEKYGVNIQELHTDHGNFLHYAIQSDEVNHNFITYLIDKKVDPKALTKNGNNLWYSLAGFRGNKDTLMHRGRLLYGLGISPHHKNNKQKSAIDIVASVITANFNFSDNFPPYGEERELLDEYYRILGNYDFHDRDRVWGRVNLLLKIMKNENFVRLGDCSRL